MNLAFPKVGTTPKVDTRPQTPLTSGEREAMLERLADLRERINDGHVARMQMAHDKERYQRFTNRWHDRVIEYLDLLGEIKDIWPRDDLITRRNAVLARLEKGWLMEPSGKLTAERIGEHFHTLLIEYEALSDLIAGFVYVHDDLATRDRMAGYRRDKFAEIEAKREARQAALLDDSLAGEQNRAENVRNDAQ